MLSAAAFLMPSPADAAPTAAADMLLAQNQMRFAMMPANEQHSTVRRLATSGWSIPQIETVTGMRPAQIQTILEPCTP